MATPIFGEPPKRAAAMRDRFSACRAVADEYIARAAIAKATGSAA